MSLDRRRFLQLSATAGALAPNLLHGQSDELTPNVLTGVLLEPFVDPLVIPPTLGPGPARHQITMSEFRQKLHRDLPPTIVWGFNGTTPGPTILARQGAGITIDWLNRLPARHRLTIDHTMDGAEKNVPEVRTSVHLHGGHVSAASDGYPHDWVTPGQQKQAIYPNQQRGSTLWYHDHAMGITRLNAVMGLAGMYIIQDPEELALGLPSGRFDIPLILQDRIFDARGQLVYPVSEMAESPWVPEFFGTQILVNGIVNPYLTVEPRLYRFRLLNASNARMYQLLLSPEQELVQIGSDGGLLAAPAVRRELFLAPAERIDMLLDFRGREGRRMTLLNHAPAPFPSGGVPVPRLVMQFHVARTLGQASNKSDAIPPSLSRIARLPESAAVETRRLMLVEVMQSMNQPHRVLLDGRRFMDPVTEKPKNHTVEIWELVNTTIDAHPIHLHIVHFQLLDRHAFDMKRFQDNGEVARTGRPMPPAPEESGWKDTILCPPGLVTRIIIPFDGEPGRFVWHCHMLEHEDNEMMRPFDLTA